MTLELFFDVYFAAEFKLFKFIRSQTIFEKCSEETSNIESNKKREKEIGKDTSCSGIV